MEPIVRSLPMIGTMTADFAVSVPGSVPMALDSASVFVTRASRVDVSVSQLTVFGVAGCTGGRRAPCSYSYR
jgi:hypothetical protein